MLLDHAHSSYESPEVALTCGVMLRECVKHEPLAKIVLDCDQFYNFFRYVEVSTFDIASDAFATFKVSFEFLNAQLIIVGVVSGAAHQTQANVCRVS